MDLLGILHISQKYLMPAVNAWSLFQLKALFPPNTAELLESTHFSRWREGQNAVELIMASERHHAPEFLPYAYYALATSDWSTKLKTTELGINRLTTDQVIMLGVGRAFLQAKLTEKVLSPNKDCVGFSDPPPVCNKPYKECTKYYSCARPDEMRYAKHHDLILWIKDAKAELMDGASQLCRECRKAWVVKAISQINLLFDEFCRAMELL